MAFLPRPVTMTMSWTPDASASSTPYWMTGLSTSSSISSAAPSSPAKSRPETGRGEDDFANAPESRSHLAEDSAARDYNGRSGFHKSLHPRLQRDLLETVRKGLQNRGIDPMHALEELAALEAERRRLMPEIEGLKREQNSLGR